MSKPDKIRAVGEMVVIGFSKIKKEKLKTAAGLEIISAETETDTYEALIDNLGPDVPETCGFKRGDSVMFNEHDLKMFKVTDPNNIMKTIDRGVCHYKSIWGVLEKTK